jgi:tetratricopeptide (TPR) repeat protein
MTTLMRSADVLVLCQSAEYDFLPIISERRSRGLPTIFEINNNLLAEQPWNDRCLLNLSESARSLVYQQASLADTLILASPMLSPVVGYLNKHTVILPSQLDTVFPRDTSPGEQDATIRIGWGGSRGQRDDISWVIPSLARLAREYPKIKIAIMGNPNLKTLLSDIPPDQLEFHGPAPRDGYIQFLQELDIGIAPLLPTEFNRCRHDAKYLEYAATGSVPLCSGLPTYRGSIRDGETGLLFNSIQQFESQLQRLINQPELRTSIADDAHNYVATHRLAHRHAHERLDLYEETCRRARMLDTSKVRQDTFFAALDQHEHTQKHKDTNYYQLDSGRLEKLLYNGFAHVTSDFAERIHSLERARDLQPDFYLPHLVLAQAYDNVDQRILALKEARALEPSSCEANFELALCFERLGDRELARRTMQHTVSETPELAMAIDRLADYAESEGEVIGAGRLRHRALRVNPWYRPPARKLADDAWERGEYEEARRLLLETVEYNEGMWHDHFILGQIYAEEQRHRLARDHLEQALHREPNSREIMTALSRVYFAQGNTDAARELLQRLKSIPRTQN